MANRINYKFYLRPDQITKLGNLNVYLYANIGGKKIYLSIGHEVPEKFWNEKDQVVKNGYRETTIINQRITAIKKEFLSIIMKADASGKIITPDDFKIAIRNPVQKDDFIVYMKQKIEQEVKTGKLAYQTKCNYLTLIKNLYELKGKIRFDQINVHLWNEIEKKAVASKHSPNTIFKTLVDIRSFVNSAVKDGILTVNPLNNIQVKKLKPEENF